MNAQAPITTPTSYILWERAPRPDYTDRLLSLLRASGRPA
jgi:hypothetical protein